MAITNSTQTEDIVAIFRMINKIVLENVVGGTGIKDNFYLTPSFMI